MAKKTVQLNLPVISEEEYAAFRAKAIVVVKVTYETIRLHSGVFCLIVFLYFFSTLKSANKDNTETLNLVTPPKVITHIEMKEATPTSPVPTAKLVNECAPVDIVSIPDVPANDYIGRFSRVAIVEMEKYGVPASISLAQGLLESRAGNSKLARGNNNHFGIKCFSKRCKKGHCTNATDDTHKDFFRKFASPWESWREHSRIVAKKTKPKTRDYKKWAYWLGTWYATDKKYATKLIACIEKHDLWKYDK